jgi:hypothetical protein
VSGRPLRFLGAMLGGWIAIRAVMLWPSLDSPAALPRLLIPVAQAEPERLPAEQPAPSAGRSPSQLTTMRPAPIAPLSARSAIVAAVEPVRLTPSPIVAGVATIRPPALSEPQQIAPLGAPVPGRPPSPRRWGGSAWLVLRDGSGAGSSFGGGQLGGAQAGVRITYAIDSAQRLAAVGRLTSPLHGVGREASVGVEWRPTPLPIRFVIEHRFALDGGKGGPAAGVIAGTGPAPMALGFDLETYGQAGVIRRDRAEPFAEGAARVTRPVTRAGHLKLDLGIGTWGAAQRDAQRLDIGPSIGITLPIGSRTIRAIGDWRQRIAGQASPGSGPTLTIGADF